MQKYLILFNIALFLTLPSAAHAIYTIEIQDGDVPYTMTVDYKGNAKFVGIIKGGNVYYSSRKSVLYYQPIIGLADDENIYSTSVYALSTQPLERNLRKYETEMLVTRAKAPERALGFLVDTWDFTYNAQLCHRLKGSPKMAARVGFDVNDFNRMHLGLSYLLGDQIKNGCNYAAIPRATGSYFGFPMDGVRVLRKTEQFRIISIIENSKIETVEFPKSENIKPLTMDAHIEAMKARLSPEILSAYRRTEVRLGDNNNLKMSAIRSLIEGSKHDLKILNDPIPIW